MRMNHLYFLQKAYEIADQIDPHLTSPNPRVGCLIVLAGKVISTGTHRKFGESHAEPEAIRKLEEKKFQDWEKSDVYITLEPCQSFPGKKTPACADLLAQKKFRNIFIGARDRHFEKNSQNFSENGAYKFLEKPEFHEKLNPFFDQYIQRKRPYITLKVAQSLDGKWQSPIGKWISNQDSRKQVHQMRAQYQGILTTIKTIETDQARLDCRLQSFHRAFSNPEVIVLGSGEIPEFFEKKSRKVSQFHNLEKLITSEKWKNLDSLMTECGPTLSSQLLRQNLVDELQVFIAPQIFGNPHKGFINPGNNLSDFYTKKVEEISGDLSWKLQKN